MESKDIERRFKSGEVIVERASAARELFIVREGSVVLDEGVGEPAHLLEPGDAFGEAAAILGQPHSVRAVAEGDAVVLALDVSLLNRLCAESPEFAVRLLRRLARQAERGSAVRESTGSAAVDASPCTAGPAEGTAAPQRTQVAESERALAGAILRCAQPGEESPLPVQGRLADLSRESSLDMLDAYACLQRLLDRNLLRLVDDQLSILTLDSLRDLAG